MKNINVFCLAFFVSLAFANKDAKKLYNSPFVNKSFNKCKNKPIIKHVFADTPVSKIKFKGILVKNNFKHAILVNEGSINKELVLVKKGYLLGADSLFLLNISTYKLTLLDYSNSNNCAVNKNKFYIYSEAI